MTSSKSKNKRKSNTLTILPTKQSEAKYNNSKSNKIKQNKTTQPTINNKQPTRYHKVYVKHKQHKIGKNVATLLTTPNQRAKQSANRHQINNNITKQQTNRSKTYHNRQISNHKSNQSNHNHQRS